LIRSRWVGVGATLAATVLSGAIQAASLSKEYVFRPEVELAIGAEVREGDVGIRLDSVQFVVRDEDRLLPFGSPMRVDVGIKNLGTDARKVGVAIALFAEDGSLVGVASGGSKWLAIKPDRKSYYTLKFEDVTGRLDEATRFRITLETK